MTAAGAEAIQFETVGLDREAVARGDFFLETFDVAIFELHDFAAVGAAQVVMMPFVGDVIVLGLRTEVPGLRQPCFTKQIERSIDGRQAQVRIFARQLVVHFFRCDVLLLEKCVKDQLALAGVLQLVLPEVVFQNAHFFLMLRHSPWPRKNDH